MSKVAAHPGAHAGTLSREHRERHRRAYLVEIVLVLGIVAFAVLALVASVVPYFAFDLPVERAIQSLQWPPLESFLAAVNWIGFPPESNVIFGSIVVGLFLVGKRWEAAGLLVAAAGSAGLWFLLAPMVHRPRPTPDLVNVESQIPYGSFPSGHVLNLTAMIGFLIFLAFTQLKPSWWRTLLLVLLALPVVGIGIARIQAGQHWPSDVLGGYLLGTVWLGVTILLYRRVKQWRAHHAGFAHPADADPPTADHPPEQRVTT